MEHSKIKRYEKFIFYGIFARYTFLCKTLSIAQCRFRLWNNCEVFIDHVICNKHWSRCYFLRVSRIKVVKAAYLKYINILPTFSYLYIHLYIIRSQWRLHIIAQLVLLPHLLLGRFAKIYIFVNDLISLHFRSWHPITNIKYLIVFVYNFIITN